MYLFSFYFRCSLSQQLCSKYKVHELFSIFLCSTSQVKPYFSIWNLGN